MRDRVGQVAGCWIDESKITELRDIINHDMPHHFDPQFQAAHTAICIMMDRVEDSASWLNMHGGMPKEASEFLLFLVHGDILLKTIVSAAKKLGINIPFREKKQLACCEYLMPHVSNDLISEVGASKADDETIWSYLRALAFAHTEKTGDKRYIGSLLRDNEIHYSPFVKIDEIQNRVGVVVYSNDPEYSNVFTLPFDALKKFVASRFALIEAMISLARHRISARNSKLMHDVIEIKKEPIDTINELRRKYVERCGDESYAYQFDFAIMCLSVESTCAENNANVEAFRKALVGKVPLMANAFGRLDYDTCFKELDEICDYSPEFFPGGECYYLQKIYAYLEKGCDKEMVACQCARYIANGFASKYVTIDVDSMGYDEIKMLITVACYFHKLRIGELNGKTWFFGVRINTHEHNL